MKTTTHTLLVTALGLLVGVVQAGELKDSKPDRVKTELVMQINVKLGADEDSGTKVPKATGSTTRSSAGTSLRAGSRAR